MGNKQRILIFTGGDLGPWAIAEIQATDFLVGVDRGAVYLIQHNLQPDYVLGDFDSVTATELTQIRQSCPALAQYDPIAKDHTDTELAYTWAIEQRPQEIIILGGLGSRFDHTLANVHLLLQALQAGIASRIIGEHNEIFLTDGNVSVTKGRYTYISVLPLTPTVTGITLSGFQYPLQQATLGLGSSLGISNVLSGEAGTIQVETGQLLIIKSID